MDKPLVQRIFELEDKVKELESNTPQLQKEIEKIRDFVGMNDNKFVTFKIGKKLNSKEKK